MKIDIQEAIDATMWELNIHGGGTKKNQHNGSHRTSAAVNIEVMNNDDPRNGGGRVSSVVDYCYACQVLWEQVQS
jgi:hypothetical protein